MTDIESRVAESLRADAERVPYPSGLAGRAIARAGVLRRRRRIASVAAILTVLGVSFPAALQLQAGRPDPAPAPLAAPQISAPTQATTLPAVTVRAAATLPSAVGSDPRLLHFDVDQTALHATVSTWISSPDVEGYVAESATGEPRTKIFLGRAADRLEAARVMPIGPPDRGLTPRPRSRSAAPESVMVDGRAATIERQPGIGSAVPPSWVLRWQPVAGLYALAQTYGGNRDAALAVPSALRLDRSQRCVTPFGGVDRSGLTTCKTSIRADRPGWTGSELKWADGRSIWAWDEPAKSFQPNTTAAGRDARWRDKDMPGLWFADLQGAQVLINAASQEQAGTVAAALTFATDLTSPSSWPQ